MSKKEFESMRPFVIAFFIIFIIAFVVIKFFEWRLPERERSLPEPPPPIEEYLNEILPEQDPFEAENVVTVGEEALNNEEIEILARDGQLLNVRVTKPAGVGPFPTLVLVHGVSSSAQLTQQVSALYGEEFSEELEMMVVSVDWRDSTFGEGDFTDVVSAIDWATTLQERGDEPVIVFGLDHGVYLSLLATNEVEVDGVVAAYGSVDLLEQYKHLQQNKLEHAGLFLEKTGCQKVVDTDGCLRQLSLRDRIDIHVPTLIIHGADDTITPPSQSELLKSFIGEEYAQYELLDSENAEEQIARVFDESTAPGHAQAMEKLYEWLETNFDL